MSNIYQIAEEAGVSFKTAARILAGAGGRPENRRRVLEAARRLNYVRNQQAATLRSGKSGLIGLILPDIRNPIYPTFCGHIHDAVLRLGYRILLANTYGSAREEMETLRMFEINRVEGIILLGSEREPDEACDETIASILQRGIPILLGGRPPRGLRADQIVIENASAVRKAIRHLAQNGRKRIAFIGGPEHLLACRERLSGYTGGLKAHGLRLTERLVSFGEFTVESGLEQTARLLARPPLPEAIFAANDLLAIGAIQAILERDIRIPEEIAVIGFDDIPFAGLMRPQLTTLRQPHRQMAEESVELLARRIKEGGAEAPLRQLRQLRYEPELIVRESA